MRRGLISHKNLKMSKEGYSSLASRLSGSSSTYWGSGDMEGASILLSYFTEVCKTVPRLCLMKSKASWAEGEAKEAFPGLPAGQIGAHTRPQACFIAEDENSGSASLPHSGSQESEASSTDWHFSVIVCFYFQFNLIFHGLPVAF